MRTTSLYLIVLLGAMIASAQPKLVKRADPVYPDEAKKAKIEGSVFVGATISANGTVTAAKVIKSSAKELDQAALDAAKGFVFEPWSPDGTTPDNVMVTIPFKFKLVDDKKKK
jgi:protein TonB